MNQASNVCPYLRRTETQCGNVSKPLEAHQCHATVTPFAPSAVQQSSCCFNSALFARCPYYVAVGQAEDTTAVPHQPIRRNSFLAQFSRFFAFGKKKRRRIYYL